MSITKEIAKGVVFPAMMKLGLDQPLRNISNHSLLNVMYHGVVEESSLYFSPRHIQADRFEDHLKYFKKNFNIISFYEAFEMVKNNQKPDKKTITISFDDGFKNNLITALPLLEKYEIPTTFFISGICAENTEDICLWPEWMAALNYFEKDTLVALGPHEFKNMVDINSGLHMFDFLKAVSFNERRELLDLLITTYNLSDKIKTVSEEAWKLLTRKELLSLSESPIVDIGSHGYLHYNLGCIEPNMAKIELEKSKKILEELIGKEIDMIAYPDGSYNEEVKDMATSIGYKYQLAVDYKTSEDIKDLRIMNRHCMSAATTFGSNMIMLNRSFLSKGIKV